VEKKKKAKGHNHVGENSRHVTVEVLRKVPWLWGVRYNKGGGRKEKKKIRSWGELSKGGVWGKRRCGYRPYAANRLSGKRYLQKRDSYIAERGRRARDNQTTVLANRKNTLQNQKKNGLRGKNI